MESKMDDEISKFGKARTNADAIPEEYRDISIGDETVINPLPEHVADEMKKRYLYIMIGESMILSEPDDTHLTVFNPDPQLLELIRQIASGEGLFVWKPTFS